MYLGVLIGGGYIAVRTIVMGNVFYLDNTIKAALLDDHGVDSVQRIHRRLIRKSLVFATVDGDSVQFTLDTDIFGNYKLERSNVEIIPEVEEETFFSEIEVVPETEPSEIQIVGESADIQIVGESSEITVIGIPEQHVETQIRKPQMVTDVGRMVNWVVTTYDYGWEYTKYMWTKTIYPYLFLLFCGMFCFWKYVLTFERKRQIIFILTGRRVYENS